MRERGRPRCTIDMHPHGGGARHRRYRALSIQPTASSLVNRQERRFVSTLIGSRIYNERPDTIPIPRPIA